MENNPGFSFDPSIKKHYQNLFDQHGDTPASAQWSDLKTQERRFQILSEIAPLNGTSILDFGCGAAHLATYFKKCGIQVRYTGTDIVETFIEHAKKKHPECDFFLPGQLSGKQFDYVLISGVFNNKLDDNAAFYRQTLKNCFALAKKGLAFNMMSKYVDYYSEGLYYASPEEVFKFAKTELSPYVTLRNDYQVKENTIPFEFAVYVYRK